MVHEVPFHLSASVCPPVNELTLDFPTAEQALLDEQETPDNRLICTPVGFGLVWTAHVLPFHRSASVRVEPEPSSYWPTAVQAVAVGHETPERTELVAPLGCGAVSRLQLVPFQLSASGTVTPEPFV